MVLAYLLAVTKAFSSDTCSQNSSAVMILVVLAIGRGWSAFFSYSTCPLTASIRMALAALICGNPDLGTWILALGLAEKASSPSSASGGSVGVALTAVGRCRVVCADVEGINTQSANAAIAKRNAIRCLPNRRRSAIGSVEWGAQRGASMANNLLRVAIYINILRVRTKLYHE